MTEPEAELLERFQREMKIAHEEHPPVTFELTRAQCFILLGQLQLALRHPENVGHTAKLTRALAKRLQDAVSVMPAMAEVAERGWHE